MQLRAFNRRSNNPLKPLTAAPPKFRNKSPDVLRVAVHDVKRETRCQRLESCPTASLHGSREGCLPGSERGVSAGTDSEVNQCTEKECLRENPMRSLDVLLCTNSTQQTFKVLQVPTVTIAQCYKRCYVAFCRCACACTLLRGSLASTRTLERVAHILYNADHAFDAGHAQGRVDVEQELVRRKAVRNHWEGDQQAVGSPQY